MSLFSFNRKKDASTNVSRRTIAEECTSLAQASNRGELGSRIAPLVLAHSPVDIQQMKRNFATKVRDLDPEYPEPYSWLSVLYQSVLANLEPDKEARYTAEGQKNLEKFQELRKRAAERKKLEEELKAIK